MHDASRAAALLLGAALLSGACGGDEASAPSVAVGPTLVFPRALLDNVKRLTMTVYDSTDGADCNADGTAKSGSATPILTKDLDTTGCAGGARFCGDLQIKKADDRDRVFAAKGFAQNNDVLAVGCTRARVNQDALPVTITMLRFVKPAVCGNGVVEPTEQCEPPGATGDPLCDASCHTREVYLSGGRGASGTTRNGNPGDKKNPFFLWPADTGVAGKFIALFGDKSVTPTDVDVRVLSDSFQRYATQGSEMADYSFFLPNQPTGSFPPPAEPNNQAFPAAAAIGGKYYVAFEDDTNGTVDIHLRSMDQQLAAQQATAVGINGPSGDEPGVQSQPTVAAGSNGLLYIAWQDDSGVVRGRTYNPQSGALGTESDISTGLTNKHVVVASLGAPGWIATWESGNDVKVRAIDPTGKPIGTEQKVNDATHSGAQQHPWIAALSDGRYAIVWGDRGSQDVFVQRFGADGKPVPGDQTATVNDVVKTGDQSTPVIAATPGAGGSFVAAWIDGASGHVRARFLGGTSGFLFNNVDAQSDEFQASATDGRTRANPTVAVGGNGPFVVIGWEDTTNDPNKAGIYGRRFPVPTE